MEDARRIWEWRNDPAARAASFSPEPIAYADHEGWFARALADPTFRFLIALDGDDQPLGYIRFRLRDREAEISVSFDPGRRGQGFGAAAIRAATEWVLSYHALSSVRALVETGNGVSLRAFQRAGYELQDRRHEILGAEACELRYPPAFSSHA